MKRIKFLLFYNNFVIENTEINKISKNDFTDTNSEYLFTIVIYV